MKIKSASEKRPMTKLERIEKMYGPDFGMSGDELRKALRGKKYEALRGLVFND